MYYGEFENSQWEINANLVENDFRMKEINAKERVTFQMMEINSTCTKEQNLLDLGVYPTNFDKYYLISCVKRRNLATSNSSQFHCCWRISTLIKYSSFLGVKNVRSVLRIWGQKHKN